jgi:CubicO group peptidase (beta-lactamase class C family)
MPLDRRLIRTALVATTLACATGSAGAQESLDALLEPHLAKHGLPAVAAAVTVGGKVVAAGAAGTRKAGAKLPVTVNDRFHLGSDTKAMTALLAAMLVEAEKLRWDSTVAEVFPELADKMDSGLKGVTLEQLLSHTSGIPGDNKAFKELLEQSLAQDGNLDELRYWLVKHWAPQPLPVKPGTTFAYANMNYVLAGAMIERAGGGKTWEELVTERVFTPLELRSAGLGPQATLGRIDAPLGHELIDGKAKAFLAGPNGDNPLVLGPAGTAHMSVLDFARWASWHAGEGKRGPNLVRPETLKKKLHAMVISTPEIKDPAPGTPRSGKYGLGWGQLSMAWAPEPLLFHGGSNGKNIAHVWVEPKRDLAMVLVTNIGGKKAEEALFALAPELYKKFAAPKRAGEGPR